MHPFKAAQGFVFLFKNRRINPFNLHPDIIGNAAVNQSFHQGFISIFQHDIFADNGNAHFAIGGGDAPDDIAPSIKLRRGGIFNPESGQHFGVKAFAVIGERDFVNGAAIHGFDNRCGAYITKQCDLAFFRFRNRSVRPHQQNIRLNTD